MFPVMQLIPSILSMSLSSNKDWLSGLVQHCWRLIFFFLMFLPPFLFSYLIAKFYCDDLRGKIVWKKGPEATLYLASCYGWWSHKLLAASYYSWTILAALLVILHMWVKLRYDSQCEKHSLTAFKLPPVSKFFVVVFVTHTKIITGLI